MVLPRTVAERAITAACHACHAAPGDGTGPVARATHQGHAGPRPRRGCGARRGPL